MQTARIADDSGRVALTAAELTGVTGFKSGGGGACGLVAIWTGGR